jgi:DNA repair exonuclease SbcCD ATPase subunit
MTEQEEATEEVSVAVEEEVQQPEATPTEDKRRDVEHNWKQARTVIASQQQAVAERDQKINQLEQRLNELQLQREEIEDKYDPEEYATNKHVDKVADKKVTKKTKVLEEKIHNLEKKLHDADQKRLESEVAAQYDDYEYVVENFALPMVQKDPALAAALRASPNPYAMAYRMAKASDEYESSQAKQDKPNPKAQKILKNSERPVAAQAAGGSLKSQTEYFSNLSPQQIWQKSQEYASRA